MAYAPLIVPFTSSTYMRAFIIAAVTTGLVTGIAVEIRFAMDKHWKINRWVRWLYMVITIAVAFIVSLTVNCTLRYLFGSGGGMLAPADGNMGSTFNHP